MKSLSTLFHSILILCAAALLANAQVPPPVSAPESPESKLEEKQLGKIRPVHAVGDIYLAGQPAPEDLPLLKSAGIKTVITLRKPNEVPWDEAAAVQQQGMKYVSVPFQGADELKPQLFDQLLKELRDKQNGPILFHCGSANRVGAIWYAHRVLQDDIAPEAALKEAKTVGLRTPAYLERAQLYVQQKQRAAAQASSAPAANP